MDPLSGRVAARFLADRTANDAVNVQKLERLIDSMEKEVKQMNSSLDLYKKDSGKYKPQLDNLSNAAGSVRSMASVVLRMFGERLAHARTAGEGDDAKSLEAAKQFIEQLMDLAGKAKHELETKKDPGMAMSHLVGHMKNYQHDDWYEHWYR